LYKSHSKANQSLLNHPINKEAGIKRQYLFSKGHIGLHIPEYNHLNYLKIDPFEYARLKFLDNRKIKFEIGSQNKV